MENRSTSADSNTTKHAEEELDKKVDGEVESDLQLYKHLQLPKYMIIIMLEFEYYIDEVSSCERVYSEVSRPPSMSVSDSD